MVREDAPFYVNGELTGFSEHQRALSIEAIAARSSIETKWQTRWKSANQGIVRLGRDQHHRRTYAQEGFSEVQGMRREGASAHELHAWRETALRGFRGNYCSSSTTSVRPFAITTRRRTCAACVTSDARKPTYGLPVCYIASALISSTRTST
jgi:hypothetical protein